MKFFEHTHMIHKVGTSDTTVPKALCNTTQNLTGSDLQTPISMSFPENLFRHLHKLSSTYSAMAAGAL